ncbi:MAG: OmpA family protein [Mailhella sp.]|nr:OmpA family protein [Mailhella sp.]
MKSLRSVLFAAALLMGMTPAAMAADYVRKVDSFDVLMDYSGSMMMKEATTKQPKLELAKAVVTKMNNALPDLGYMASYHTFAPKSTLVPYGDFNAEAANAAVAKLNSNLDPFARLTPMGDGLSAVAPEYQNMARPTAVVIVSDGANNIGIDPVAEAQAIVEAQPGVCFHVISFADEPAGKETLDKIAALNDCSVVANGIDLYNDQAALEKFVKDVFYDDGGEAAIVLHGVNFAFDSYALDNKAQDTLNEVAALLKADPAKVTLEGWTDSIGTDAYNKTLSQRRAESVKNYLVKNGVPADSLTAKGMGKSFKYNNSTADGRYLNRRVELLFD